jgi:adenine-specific DNA-methyltransferase
MDLFYYFIHLGILKLNPGGILSYITTNYWITKSKKTGIKYLKPHIIDECFLLQYVDLSSIKIFRDALGQHNCIFILQKKNESEKESKIDKRIDIAQIRRSFNENSHEKIFLDLLSDDASANILKYESALTNKNLKRDNSWTLKYPLEVKKEVDKIEKYCRFDGIRSFLIEFFDIRNGLILIKDDVFILHEGNNLKIVDDDIYILVNDRFAKLNDAEKKVLKKVYKSKAITPFSYNIEDLSGFLIYFDKQSFIPENYPNIIAYLNQYKDDLEEILINAKENPKDIYFPRRGSYITQYDLKGDRKLINLEPYYDASPKIFFSYISKSNTFGYTEDPYFATSDTYFLWPKEGKNDIDYLFFIAFLNSKIVKFLFKAKNIKIKRSKTKLEDEIPIPNVKLFHSKEQVEVINIIRYITSNLIKNKANFDNSKFRKLKEMFPNLYSQIINEENFKRIIDVLFFALFGISEEDIDFLTEKYYS